MVKHFNFILKLNQQLNSELLTHNTESENKRNEQANRGTRYGLIIYMVVSPLPVIHLPRYTKQTIAE